MKARNFTFFIILALLSTTSWEFAVAKAGKTPALSRCLIEIMPITDRMTLNTKRKGIEAPFVLNDRFVVFPAVKSQRVVGFYIYGENSASYYDAVEVQVGQTTVQRSLEHLKFSAERGIYDLITQPDGIETISIEYMPGFDPQSTLTNGPVVLGASVLPVVGAFVSRPEYQKVIYHNPKRATDTEVKNWAYSQMAGGRKPAAEAELPEVHKTVVKLLKSHSQKSEVTWAPLRQELRIRRAWIKENNLDTESYKILNRALAMGCGS